MKYKQLESEKLALEKVLNTKVSSSAATDLRIKLFKCEKTIDQFKSHCAYRPTDSQQQVELPTLQRNQDAAVNKNFAAQIPVSDDLYKISIKLTNRTKSNKFGGGGGGGRMMLNSDGGGDDGGGGGGHFVVENTKLSGDHIDHKIIINSVENFQIIPKQINAVDQNVLQEPPSNLNAIKSSTASSTGHKRTSESSNNLDRKVMAPIAIIPTQTPETRRTTKATRIKSIPVGVVPLQSVPDDFDQEKLEDPGAPGAPSSNVIEPNRYLNAIEASNVGEHPPKTPNVINKQRSRSENFQNVNELENGAHEINDNNDFNIDDNAHNGKQGGNNQMASVDHHHKDHLQEPLLNQNVNNAAEDDTNLYDAANRMENDVDLEIIKKRGGGDGHDGQQHRHPEQHSDHHHSNDGHDPNGHDGGRNKYGNNDKLMNEIAGDQGKVAEYMDDMREDLHMEEAAEEEDGRLCLCFIVVFSDVLYFVVSILFFTDDEYANPAARKQDPAVRN